MELLPVAAATVQRYLTAGLDLLFPIALPEDGELLSIRPPWCQRCGIPFEAAGGHLESCGQCQGRQWSFDRARAGYRARGAVRDAIIGFKYQDRFYLRRLLIRWLLDGYDAHEAKAIPAWTGAVPVPLHRLRQRERGFNQALELARGLARARGLPLMDCLTRTRDTPKQALLDRHDRLSNLRSAFRVKGSFDLRGHHLLLIDDVFTTGATAEACARTLKKARAARVGVLTVARG